MTSQANEFQRRVARIPFHGLGLSVDVHSPDLFDLLDALEDDQLALGYLEIFKAPRRVLKRVRTRLPSAMLEYHGEGLWVTQPDLICAYPLQEELALACGHLQALGSHWINHECASKQMAGYSFGTYLRPLFTQSSAEVTAENLNVIQGTLDRIAVRTDQPGPLLLLEVAPLTYFGFGDISVPEFFRAITHRSPCGLVLDIGHLWTIYRYTCVYRRQSVHEFMGEFLEAFPIERVVQVHVAGLGPGPNPRTTRDRSMDKSVTAPPLWIDAHGEPVPHVLFEMLEVVLADPRLAHLKGLALEVDNKSIPQIISEFKRCRAFFQDKLETGRHPSEAARQSCWRSAPVVDTWGRRQPQCGRGRGVLQQYEAYAQVASGKKNPTDLALGSIQFDPDLLELYAQVYLPWEIVEWGGDLRDMFPETCRRLDERGMMLMTFVDFWFRAPRSADEPYDFFLLKIERFVEFIREVLPDSMEMVLREAHDLRNAYRDATEGVGIAGEVS